MNLKFLNNIEQFNMLEDGDRIIACVSGGMDSVFLLYNLYHLKKRYNLDIVVAHVNHGVRKTAKRDEDFVRGLAEKMNLEYRVKHIKMNEYAKENKMSSEEAGRLLRYDFFRSLAGKNAKIFLAHNANDQAETVLYRIIRGTGIKGLCAMEYIDNNLYRPMLDIKRTEIEQYIMENEILYVQDETNFSDIYARNKIRLKIIPYIEENFNDNFVDSLIRLSDISRDNYDYIDKKVNELMKNYYDNGIILTDKLNKYHEYILSEFLRAYILKETGSLEGITSKNVSDIVKMIKNNKNSSVTLPKNLIMVKSYNNLYILKNEETLSEKEIILKDGLNRTKFGNIYIERSKYYKKGKNIVSIDSSKVKGDLRVRKRKNGDRFVPFGMNSEKKLKDFFIDLKIDRYLRDKIGIITDENEIIWVMPYRLSNNYAVDNETTEFINIYLED